jgi:hypothetical protein
MLLIVRCLEFLVTLLLLFGQGPGCLFAKVLFLLVVYYVQSLICAFDFLS